jgi:peptide/nickel transport system substrate-binding protein
MRRGLYTFVAACLLLIAIAAAEPAFAQKHGGILKIPHLDSPASMSIHEESTIAVLGPMMGVFNNLVMFDQHVKQNSLEAIVPDLAPSWSWNEEGTKLTFTLRQGVRWHDGMPFTARDVSAPGIWSAGSRARSSGSIRASPGIETSKR